MLERSKEKQGGQVVLFDWNGREHREADITRWTKVSLSSTGVRRLSRILNRAVVVQCQQQEKSCSYLYRMGWESDRLEIQGTEALLRFPHTFNKAR